MARLYLALYRRLKSLIFHLDTLFAGFALGFLSRDQWHAVDELMYQRIPEYQSEEHNLKGFFPWEIEAMDSTFQDCRRVLVLGAGGGREVLALAQPGREVVGYECNHALVAHAQKLLHQQGCSGRVEFLARDAVPPGGENYDGVILGWSMYMLVIGRKHRIALLQELRQQMVEGAPILLSFFTRNENARRISRVARIANSIRALLRRPKIEVGDDIAPNYVHRFNEAEVKAELAEAGFELIRYREQKPGPIEPGYAVGVLKGQP